MSLNPVRWVGSWLLGDIGRTQLPLLTNEQRYRMALEVITELGMADADLAVTIARRALEEA